jgi:hypothetical protein
MAMLSLLESAALPNVQGTRQSFRALPSATLGKEHTAKKLSVKRPLPSVFYRAVGKGFAECPTLGKGQTEKF